jgi:DNA-binding NtrC family response regulator
MTLQNYTILLVDDDAKLIRGLERHLASDSCSVFSAVSAREAMAVVCGTHIDVVVCDNAMPGMSGVALLAHFRRDHPEVRRIMLTGELSARDRGRLSRDIGVDAILEKPCDAACLAATIQRVLWGKQQASNYRSRHLLEESQLDSKWTSDTHGIIQSISRWLMNKNGEEHSQ